jgi:hypothetical protein
MNKRMRELAEQAGMLRDKFGLYQDARDPDDGVDLEKFAELIVRECARACLDEGAKWRGEQDITDFKLCARVIKEHFGVE